MEDPEAFHNNLLHWLAAQRSFSLFRGNGFDPLFGSFENFAAAGEVDALILNVEDPFNSLKNFYDRKRDWLIGRLSYDLKNHIEKLVSRNTDRLGSPLMSFFIPETLIFFENDKVRIESYNDPVEIWREIEAINPAYSHAVIHEINTDAEKAAYLENVGKIKNQILEGDFYELNYCMESYATVQDLDPAHLYHSLNEISPMPFSVFQGIHGDFIMSASPERFLKMKENLIIAQPIKGTMRKDPDPLKNRELIQQLRSSEKEIAENMMIMDLMRNDLAKSAKTGSVKVPELFEVYSFSHLHQMISTITAEKRVGVHPVDVIRNAFPMGSMTGAPKIKAMEMIDRYENSSRGNFSGAAGYIKPNGDFDFNVLIRSFFYNSARSLLKFSVGSAITYDASPEAEYNECLLKATALRQALNKVDISQVRNCR